MSEVILTGLKELIAKKLDVNLKLEEIDENVSLFEDGLGLDSIAIVELILTVEKEFSIRIADEEFTKDIFKNLKVLANFIHSKQKN